MISIIIPIYNTEKYLKQCLDSVMVQTFSDWEALLIDDGSNKECKKIIKSFIKKDKRFKYLGGTHIGFPLSKNLGLDNAKGDYICFLDSDDYLHPRYLELLYKGLLESNTDICCCDYEIVSEKGTRIPEIKNIKLELFGKDRLYKMFSRPITTFMWNKIYKKSLFTGMRFEDVIALSDTMLCPKIIENARSISYISSRLIIHRIHNENMTYRVKHFEPTYWEHRLKVYLDILTYLSIKYPEYKFYYMKIFTDEMNKIKNFLDEKVYNKYIECREVRYLLLI